MKRIRLIHWHETEAQEKISLLRAIGFEVDYELPQAPVLLRELQKAPPQLVVIDLSRLPMQGRDFGLILRKFKSTRQVPIIFVGGKNEKVARVKELLPDAVYTSWDQIAVAVPQAVAQPPVNPVVPRSVFDGYAGRPLTQKLGIKAGTRIALINAPDGFEESLGELPEGVHLVRQIIESNDLVLWFTRSKKELVEQIASVTATLGGGRLWIIWQKKSARSTTDLTQQRVRDIGLAAGLVDYKICSLDETWSGLLFCRRQAK